MNNQSDHSSAVSDEPASRFAFINNCMGTKADRRNQYRFCIWLFAWALSHVGFTFILKEDIVSDGSQSWLVITVSALLAAQAVRSYLRFLRETDELTRLIQLEGLAFGFTAGAAFALLYSLLLEAGWSDPGISSVVVVMMVGWSLGQLFAAWRYQ